MFEAQKSGLCIIFEPEFMVEFTTLSWGCRSKAIIMQNGREAVQHATAFPSMHVIVQKAHGSSHLGICMFLTENVLYSHE
jgi:hypothetical protein